MGKRPLPNGVASLQRHRKRRARSRLIKPSLVLAGAAFVGLAVGSAASFSSGIVGAAEPSARSKNSSVGERFTCTPIKLWDGDGPIHCAEGPKIRLAGIAAREVEWTGSEMVDAGCREGHPCPATSGVAARDHLAGLLSAKSEAVSDLLPTGHVAIEGPALSCTSNGSAGGSRTAAWCVSPRVGDLSCAMVNGGYAARWTKYWRGHCS